MSQHVGSLGHQPDTSLGGGTRGAGAGPRAWALDAGLLLVRVGLAGPMVYHGSQKLFGWFGGYGIEGTAGWMASQGIPLPVLSTALAGGAEFFGGLALLAGLFARPAAAALAFTMLVAAWTHRTGGYSAATGGLEYPLTLALVLAGVALAGPGRWTLPRWARALTGSGVTRRDTDGALAAS